MKEFIVTQRRRERVNRCAVAAPSLCHRCACQHHEPADMDIGDEPDTDYIDVYEVTNAE